MANWGVIRIDEGNGWSPGDRLRAASSHVSRLEEIVPCRAWTGKAPMNDERVSVEPFRHERSKPSISLRIADEAMKRLLADATASKEARAAVQAAGRRSA